MPEVPGGKRVRVTGAFSGVGAATAVTRAEAGAQALAAAIPGPVTARPDACTDPIELRPIGRP